MRLCIARVSPQSPVRSRRETGCSPVPAGTPNGPSSKGPTPDFQQTKALLPFGTPGRSNRTLSNRRGIRKKGRVSGDGETDIPPRPGFTMPSCTAMSGGSFVSPSTRTPNDLESLAIRGAKPVRSANIDLKTSGIAGDSPKALQKQYTTRLFANPLDLSEPPRGSVQRDPPCDTRRKSLLALVCPERFGLSRKF